MKWIVENLTLIKDFTTIVLAIIASIISIITYQRAKKTFLQPLKTEVMKRQADILSDMINDLGIDNGELINRIDYFGIAELNVSKYLSEMGCKFREHDTILNNIKKNNAGALIVNETDELKEIKVVIGLEKEGLDDVFKPDDRQDKAFKGNFKMELLYFTYQFQSFNDKLNKYMNSPYIPLKIQTELIQLKNEINYNLNTVMKNSFETLINKMYKNMNDGIFNEWLKPIGLHNHFIRNMKCHDNYSEKVVKLIREQFKVDEDW